MAPSRLVHRQTDREICQSIGEITRRVRPRANTKRRQIDGGQTKRSSAKASRKRPPLALVPAMLVLAGIALGGIYFWQSRLTETTDDAYTDGRAVQVAPEVSGQVVSLEVTDNQFVTKGQALVRLDPRTFLLGLDRAQGLLDMAKSRLAGQRFGAEIAMKNFPAAMQVAKANLANAEAVLAQRQADDDRQKRLPKQATTQQDIDNASANLQIAQAQVLLMKAQLVQAEPVKQNIGQADRQVGQSQGQFAQAQAQFDQAKLDLSHTVVHAAQDGWVTNRQVDVGTYLQTGQQIMALVSPEVWVTANFKETQLDQMRPGQSVKIKVDAFPNLELRGHVDSIQLGSGSSFSTFPAESATGNFVKVVQRVPVKIVIDSGLDPTLPLPLGISVEPTVSVR